MLYVFHGSNIETSKQKAHVLINSLRVKKPDAAFETLTAETWDHAAVESHLGGQGLFSNKYIIFLDRLSDNAGIREQVVEFLPALGESENIFILLEGKMNAEMTKAFDKYADKVVISDASANTVVKRDEFNIFALADAVGSRDSVKSWKIFREAVDRGHEPESIIGTLFWQVKSMALAAPAASASSAGLSPFVFSKSKKYASNYTAEELSRLTKDLIVLYHDGHRGLIDLELATERLLVQI